MMRRMLNPAPLGAAIVLMVGLFTAAPAAAQETIAVMKLEPIGEVSADIVDGLSEGLKDAVRKSGMTLGAQGSDVMLADVEFILEDCDVTQNDCLDRVAEMFGAQHLVYGAVVAGGPTTLVWYARGKGIQRELTDTVTDKASAAKLARRLIAGETGKLIVSTGQDSAAEVIVDNQPVGLTPYEAEVAVGAHTVQVRKAGYLESSQRTVEVRQGEIATVDFALEVDPNAVKSGEMTTMTKVGWIITGVGGAALVGATVTSVLMTSTEDELNDEVKAAQRGEPERFNTAKDLKDKGETLELTSNILWGVGGTLAVTGLTLVIIGYVDDGGSEADSGADLDFDLIVGRDGALGTIGLSF